MIINFREKPHSAVTDASAGGRVFVDGREVRLVWFVDSDAAEVKSYDVNGDGTAHAPRDFVDWPAGVEDVGGVMSITIRGAVEVRLP